MKALDDVREILTKIVVENEYDEEGVDIEEDKRNNMEEKDDDDDDDDDDDESDEEKDGEEGKTEEEVRNILLFRLIYCLLL